MDEGRRPDPWRGRRLASAVGAVCVFVVVVLWAALGNGSWVLAAVMAIAALLWVDAMRRSAREWGSGTPDVPARGPGAAGGTRIVVERPAAGYSDRMRGYRVLVDGRMAGHLLPGESVEVPVEPGDHVVQLRIDWARSRVVSVRVEDGATVRLAGRPRPAWAALFWITLGARRYPSLSVAPRE